MECFYHRILYRTHCRDVRLSERERERESLSLSDTAPLKVTDPVDTSEWVRVCLCSLLCVCRPTPYKQATIVVSLLKHRWTKDGREKYTFYHFYQNKNFAIPAITSAKYVYVANNI
jgi:hypothetical protein